jgi:hypothetical protein
MDVEKGHGEIGKAAPEFTSFTNLISPPRVAPYDPIKLGVLAAAMATARDSLSDGPDPEENLFMPAGYTYLGQFIDHDLTLDLTSTLNPDDLKNPTKPVNDPSNARSPRFDLDCVYGTGPGDRPYMYAVADDAANGVYGGATLLIETMDLSRAANGRAIIGDKRNDENSIVNQIQQIFIRFHNKVVAQLAAGEPNLRGGALFARARDEVRWTYQQIVLDDFLPRIIDTATLDNFRQTHKYELYPPELRSNLPREFVAAAYRFGHSAVRTGYRLQGQPGPSNGTILPIFKNPPASNVDDSLVGFDPLPVRHVIDDWGRFFSSGIPAAGERLLSNVGEGADVDDDGTGGEGKLRLQYAYKLDPSITDPLANVPPKIASKDEIFPAELRDPPPNVPGPSLALLNLLRGNRYGLHGGQAYARKIGLRPLDPKYLCIRQTVKTPTGKVFSITRISDLLDRDGKPLGDAFDADTPLWFYILAEAQIPVIDFWLEHGQKDLTENQLKGLGADGTAVPIDGATPMSVADALRQLADTRCAGTQLRGVGGRIVTEVFYGLMESDDESVLRSARKPLGWEPVFGCGPATMPRLLRYVDPARAPK